MVNGEANEVASSVIDNYTIFLTDIQSLHGGDFTFSHEIFFIHRRQRAVNWMIIKLGNEMKPFRTPKATLAIFCLLRNPMSIPRRLEANWRRCTWCWKWKMFESLERRTSRAPMNERKNVWMEKSERMWTRSEARDGAKCKFSCISFSSMVRQWTFPSINIWMNLKFSNFPSEDFNEWTMVRDSNSATK